MDSKKRERAANFTSVEVELLVRLVEKNKHIIENKKTDAVTNKDKDATWKKIESSFNSCGISNSYRTWKTLKLKYEGIKKITKKKSSMQRQEMYKTGGGPSNAPDFNNAEEMVLSICSNITGLEARHDSDDIILPTISIPELSAMEVNIEESQTTALEEIEEQDNAHTANVIIPDLDGSLVLNMNEEDTESQKENKWVKWHPKALKAKMSSVLKTDTVNKASVTRKLDKLTAARLELVQIQMETALKEQKHKDAEHQLKMMHHRNEEARKNEMHDLIMEKLRNVSSGAILKDHV